MFRHPERVRSTSGQRRTFIDLKVSRGNSRSQSKVSSLRLVFSRASFAAKDEPDRRGRHAYLMTLRQNTRYAAVPDATRRIPHIGTMLMRTEVADISYSRLARLRLQHHCFVLACTTRSAGVVFNDVLMLTLRPVVSLRSPVAPVCARSTNVTLSIAVYRRIRCYSLTARMP